MKEMLEWLKDALGVGALILIIGYSLSQGYPIIRDLIHEVVYTHRHEAPSSHPPEVVEVVRVPHTTHSVQEYPWVTSWVADFVTQRAARNPQIQQNQFGEWEVSHIVIFENHESGRGKYFALHTNFGANLLRRKVLEHNRELQRLNQNQALDLRIWFPNELLSLPEDRSRCSIYDSPERLRDPLVMSCHLLLQLSIRGQEHRGNGQKFLPYTRRGNSGELLILPNNEGLRILGIEFEIIILSPQEYNRINIW